jgi:hypothetical protein
MAEFLQASTSALEVIEVHAFDFSLVSRTLFSTKFKQFINKGVRLWIGLNWLREVPVTGCSKHGNESSGYHIRRQTY